MKKFKNKNLTASSKNWIARQFSDPYTKLAKQYPSKIEYFYTGSSSQAGGSVNLPAKNAIISSVFLSKQGNNHMSTNVDAVASLMNTFQ